MHPHTIHAPRSASPRRAVLAVLAATSIIVGGSMIAPPASADTADISSKADLDARLRDAPVDGPITIRLAQDLTSDDDAHDSPTIPDGSIVVLDLHGQRLVLQRLSLGVSAHLAITDSTPGAAEGSLQVGSPGSSSSGTPTGISIGSRASLEVSATQVSAYGSDVDRSAGIGSPASVTADAGRLVLTDGAVVSGQGGKGGAGVGGAQAAAAISVSVLDSRLVGRGGLGGAGVGSGRSGVSFGGLTATSSPPASSGTSDPVLRSSSIDASGGRGAAGIGGGLHASGGMVRLGGDTDANVSTSGAVTGSSGAPSAVGAGQAPVAAAATFGALQVGRRAWLWINDRQDPLIVPADAEVVNDGSIRALGGVTGDGTIDNHGLVSSASSSATISPETDPGALIAVNRVTGHNYEVLLHPNGGADPSRSRVRVFCAHLDPGFLPSVQAAQQGWSQIAWNTRADGSGEDYSDQSLEELTGEESEDGSPVTLDLYARFGVTPRFTGSSMPVAAVGRPYDQPLPITGEGITGYEIADHDQDGADIPTLPAGLRLDAGTGRITGTPAEAGTYRLRAVTGGANPLSGSVSITIAGSPAIVLAPIPAGRQGTAYSTLLTATGGGTFAWSLAGGSLPQGLSLSPSGVLSGIPTGSDGAGFTVQASNEKGKAFATFHLDVEAASAPVPPPTGPATIPSPAPSPTTSAPAQGAGPNSTASAAVPVPVPVLVGPQRVDARLGRQLAVSVSSSGAVPADYRVRGALPSGITLDSRSGLISGTPVEAGTFRSTITASAAGGSSSRSITFVVAARKELIGVRPVGSTWAGTRPLPLTMTRMERGERFRVRIDGRTVRSGRVVRSGVVRTSITFDETERDTAHRVEISTDRKNTDPSTTASTSFRITSLAPEKRLKAVPGTVRGARGIVVRRLAPGEEVAVRSAGVVLIRGHAGPTGEFSFARAKAGRGTHLLSITGAARTRSVTVVVRNPVR